MDDGVGFGGGFADGDTVADAGWGGAQFREFDGSAAGVSVDAIYLVGVFGDWDAGGIEGLDEVVFFVLFSNKSTRTASATEEFVSEKCG